MFQKSHIFIMMIFHARTKPYTSAMEKADLTVILLLADRTLEILTEYWFQCGRPRGDSVPKFMDRGIILQKIVSFNFFVKAPKEQAFKTRLHTLFAS